ncbi:tyrosine-type recombinase/integrase [Methylobacterium oxalidis]|uniref:tyrosine-type recombinase/integrase n=1 Tax=Methylobacterium oxalidis TaxID=944322 RepID=UPI0033156319
MNLLGATRLKEALDATTLAEAEVLKWPALARIKQRIADARTGLIPGQSMSVPSPLETAKIARQALEWRRELEKERQQLRAGEIEIEDLSFEPITDQAVRLVEEREGSKGALLFSEIVAGRATPFEHLIDDWLQEGHFAGRTEAAYRQAVRELLSWCERTGIAPTVEAITKRAVGQFIRERFIETRAAPGTANKAITGLASLWNWMDKRGHTEALLSPWSGQFLRKERRGTSDRDPGETAKRPFTDAEVATLLSGLSDPLLADFCRVAALTGMRREEIATLRVRHITGGIIKVPGTKTAAAVRDVPLHSGLVPLIERRTSGKGLNDYLFHELPAQTSDARGRGAPITQAFTRKRRALGIDDRADGERQSRIDLHSFRRWFILKAREALEGGATGFTAWTIADVVGHSREEGPLGMTMGRYPGRANIRALKACVEAVRLP